MLRKGRIHGHRLTATKHKINTAIHFRGNVANLGPEVVDDVVEDANGVHADFGRRLVEKRNQAG